MNIFRVDDKVKPIDEDVTGVITSIIDEDKVMVKWEEQNPMI